MARVFNDVMSPVQAIWFRACETLRGPMIIFRWNNQNALIVLLGIENDDNWYQHLKEKEMYPMNNASCHVLFPVKQ